jgi:hypothetical protein
MEAAPELWKQQDGIQRMTLIAYALLAGRGTRDARRRERRLIRSATPC